MNGTNPNPQMTRFAIAQGLLDAGFTLIDVGCSGGIHEHWRVFGPRLRAFGFDPQRQECARLNAAEINPNVRYFPYFVGLGPEHEFVREWEKRDPLRSHYFNMPFKRHSAGLAVESSPAVPEQNNTLGVDLTTDRISVARFVHDNAIPDIDFIKTDTDGSDFEALLSCEDVFRSHTVLGLLVEAPFTGSDEPTANTFHNIDRHLRGHGYSLYSLDIKRYSRRALPARFMLNIAAETESGQVIWGDALYFRDPVARHSEALWGKLSAVKLLRLACLYEIFNLNDCAAELIQHYRADFAAHTDPEHLLDLLTPSLDGSIYSYAEYLKAFRADPSRFFPRPPPRRTWSYLARRFFQKARMALTG